MKKLIFVRDFMGIIRKYLFIRIELRNRFSFIWNFDPQLQKSYRSLTICAHHVITTRYLSDLLFDFASHYHHLRINDKVIFNSSESSTSRDSERRYKGGYFRMEIWADFDIEQVNLVSKTHPSRLQNYKG